MGLLGRLRQFSVVTPPQIIGLPEEEIAWPVVKAWMVPIANIEPPGTAWDLALKQPNTLDVPNLAKPEIEALKFGLGRPGMLDWVRTNLDEPQVIDLDATLALSTFKIIDLLDPLARPVSHGTIYVKKEEQVRERGQVRTKTKVEPFRPPGSDLKQPKGLDIFEMLLPILMPPAATEFRDELLFPAELYPFQRAGVKWLVENESALLADDMGLGKTVQAITAFRALIRRSLALQALVICPKSVLANWMRELNRWAPELIAIQIHGGVNSRWLTWRAYLGKCHVLLTTYETIRQDQEWIKGRPFDLIVADEIQRIKNPDTATSRAVRNLGTRRRWGLTSTPLENRLEDLTAIFGFIKPGLFKPNEIGSLSSQWARRPENQWSLPLSVTDVRERVRPYILRRRKDEALPELPEKVIDTKWLELAETQRLTYVRAEREGTKRLKTTQDVTVQHVLALITQLKQICNFDPQTGDSSKVEFLIEDYLPEACSDTQKALVFSQYVKTLEEIASRIAEYDPLIYTGQLSNTQRTKSRKPSPQTTRTKSFFFPLKLEG